MPGPICCACPGSIGRPPGSPWSNRPLCCYQRAPPGSIDRLTRLIIIFQSTLPICALPIQSARIHGIAAIYQIDQSALVRSILQVSGSQAQRIRIHGIAVQFSARKIQGDRIRGIATQKTRREILVDRIRGIAFNLS